MPVPSMPCLRRSQALKGHEQPGHLLGMQARAGIAHQQAQPPPSCSAPLMVTWPPSRLYLIALETRLSSTCVKPLLIGHAGTSRCQRRDLVDQLNVA